MKLEETNLQTVVGLISKIKPHPTRFLKAVRGNTTQKILLCANCCSLLIKKTRSEPHRGHHYLINPLAPEGDVHCLLTHTHTHICSQDNKEILVHPKLSGYYFIYCSTTASNNLQKQTGHCIPEETDCFSMAGEHWNTWRCRSKSLHLVSAPLQVTSKHGDV